MAQLPRSFIDEVLARTDIVEVIGARVPLKKKGREYSACCPFHNEKTPSFYVSPDKQFYHCFGCGAHGDALRFLMEHERLDFHEAVELLARQAGLDMPRDDTPDPDAALKPLFDILERSAQLYQQTLLSSPEAVSYLKKRGVQGETAALFRLGYAPAARDFLLRELGPTPQAREHLLQAGLVIRRDDGSIYDRFRERILFPLRDRRGRVIGFGGRLLDRPAPNAPKYLNSPETPVFHKGQGLYGLYESRKADSRPERLIVVEGYMDVLMLAQHGLRNVVATLGTATTAEQIDNLFHQTATILLCFDGDEAGRRAAWKAVNVALPMMQDGRDLRVLFLPGGEDPDSLVRREGLDAFRHRLDNDALSFDAYLLHALDERHPGRDAPGLTRLVDEGRTLIDKLPQGTLRRLMFTRLNEHAGLARRPFVPAERRHNGWSGRGQPPVSDAPRLPPAPLPTPVRRFVQTLLDIGLRWPAVLAAPPSLPTGEAQDELDLLRRVLEMRRNAPTQASSALLDTLAAHPQRALLAQAIEQPIPGLNDEEAARRAFTDTLARLDSQLRREETRRKLRTQPGNAPNKDIETLRDLMKDRNTD